MVLNFFRQVLFLNVYLNLTWFVDMEKIKIELELVVVMLMVLQWWYWWWRCFADDDGGDSD